jgi:hypothetical protein
MATGFQPACYRGDLNIITIDIILLFSHIIAYLLSAYEIAGIQFIF